MKDAEQGSLGKREGCPRREIGEENMVFSNLFFIYLFLPLNLILYFVAKNRTWQNIVLLGFSLFFYAWGEPVWVFMLMAHRLFGLHLGQMH